jgi:predicted Zn-dependent protease
MKFDDLKKSVAEAALAEGILDYEIYYASSSETYVGGLNKEINSFSSGSRGGVCLRLIKDGKMGYASTELMNDGEMRELVLRAVENAKNTDKPSESGFFEGSPEYEDLRIKKYEPLGAAKLKSLTLDIMDATYAASDKVTDGTEANAISAHVGIPFASERVGVHRTPTQMKIAGNRNRRIGDLP